MKIVYFILAAPYGNPEIWWISESESPPKGGKEIAIVGKKFSTGFRVRFYGTDSDGVYHFVFFQVYTACPRKVLLFEKSSKFDYETYLEAFFVISLSLIQIQGVLLKFSSFNLKYILSCSS